MSKKKENLEKKVKVLEEAVNKIGEKVEKVEEIIMGYTDEDYEEIEKPEISEIEEKVDKDE